VTTGGGRQHLAIRSPRAFVTGQAAAAPAGAKGDAARKALAEFVGTAFLVAAIVGSGIAAQRLSPHQAGLELLENTLATAAALTAIILAVGPVSGAHLNPVITLVDRLFGGVSARDAASYVAAQLAGGITGAIVANAMFGDAAVSLSTHHRASGPHLFAEAVATFGLVLVVFGLARAGRAHFTPFAVGLYIAAAYWFTSSTSFANPAVALARMCSNTFSGIAPGSVAPFVGLEVVGGLLGASCVAVLYPQVRRDSRDAVIPREEAA
jgi:glycerol uptake facilitator-like aquaporin